ncbi:hypothetical protein [Polynucleobacter brandtiae]|uniref:Uncharacterized protein n=1 Tax=Polynucleobacter brandtiae TaxID=1938816 RepID=A0A2M8VQU2_9BURK|nr:hypothetical protein [Polynucleobacter brandtiae]PJI79522.1 hypothetical protein B0G85_1630 [Polynucleobacter brandtiae]
MVKSLIAGMLSLLSAICLANTPVPQQINGQKALVFINQDPPGTRCNTNIQIAAEIANAYRLPILILPQTAVPPLTPAPSVWFNGENIAASGGAHNGMVSYQIIADILELEGTNKQKKQGKLFNDSVRPEFDKLKSTIKTGS